LSTLEDLYNSLKKPSSPAKQEAGLKMYTETLPEQAAKTAIRQTEITRTDIKQADQPNDERIKTKKVDTKQIETKKTETNSEFIYNNDFAVSSHNKLNHKDAIFRIFAPQKNGENVGSGFFCTPNGDFLTDLHVVGDAKALQIVLNNGQRLTGIVDKRSPENDLAAGHVANPQTVLSYLKFAKGRTLEPSKSGTHIAGYAYGSDFQVLPGRFRNMSYAGVASGNLEFGENPRRQVIVSDNFTPPAMSGGVIFNADYVPIGIIDKGDIANKGFTSKTISTPIEDGLQLLKQLRIYQMDRQP